MCKTIQVVAEPISKEVFRDFGELIAHDGSSAKITVGGAFERLDPAASPALWINTLPRTDIANFPISLLERHPHSAQSFIPLGMSRSLIVVSLSSESGAPAPETIRAFVAERGQGVCYRPGTWHHGFLSIDAPTDVAVIMALTGREDDTEIERIGKSVTVVLQRPMEGVNDASVAS